MAATDTFDPLATITKREESDSVAAEGGDTLLGLLGLDPAPAGTTATDAAGLDTAAESEQTMAVGSTDSHGASNSAATASKGAKGGRRAGRVATSVKSKRNTAARVRAAVERVEGTLGVSTDEIVEQQVAVEGNLDQRLSPLVDPATGGEFFPRLLPSGLTDVEMLQRARERGHFVIYSGEPGTGKTALVRSAFPGETTILSGNGDVDTSFFNGTLLPNSNKRDPNDAMWLVREGPLPQVMEQGGVLFVDDIHTIRSLVLACLYPAMEGGREITLDEFDGRTVKATPGFFVVAAYNPNTEAGELPKALLSRFRIHQQVTTDLRLAERAGVPQRAVQAAAALRKERAAGTLSWAPEMRELIALRDLAEDFNEFFAACNLAGIAPADERDAVCAIMQTWYPDVRPLGTEDLA